LIIVVESGETIRWSLRWANFQSKVLFEKKESEALGETTVLQNRIHPSQQKLFDLLGTHCPPPSPFFSNSFMPVWSTSCGMGGVPPSDITMCFLIFVES
jgi:hypothetical protein